MARSGDPVLRAFLRAAAIAFALSGDAQAAVTGDAADAAQSHEERDSDTVTERAGSPVDIKLLDTHGRLRVRLQADGPCTLLPQPPGRYTLLVRADGLTRILRFDTPDRPLTGLEIVP